MKPALSLSVIEVKSSHKVGKDYDYDWYANDVIDNLIGISDLKRPEKNVVTLLLPYPVPVQRTKPADLKLK